MPHSLLLSLALSLCLLPIHSHAQSFREQAREAAAKGDNITAIHLYEKALHSAAKIFKEGDIELTLRRAELGEAYRAQGRFKEAIEQLDYAWKRAKYDATQNQRWRYQEGDLAISCAEKLARSYQGIGDYEKTIQTLQHAIDNNSHHQRPDQERVQLLALLTDTCLLLNRDADAALAAKQVMDITELTAETDPINTARISSTIGSIYLSHQRFDQARILLQRAIRLAAQHLPPSDPDRLRIQQQLASILIQENKLDEAIFLLQENIKQWQTSSTSEPQTLIASHLSLAQANLKKNLFNDALNHSQQARQLATKHLSNDHPDLGRSHMLSGLAQLNLQQPNTAKKDLQSAQKILSTSLGIDHPDTLTVQHALQQLTNSP